MNIKEYERLLSENNMSKEEVDEIWESSDNWKVKNCVGYGISWRDLHYITVDKWLKVEKFIRRI